jgi:hypothetical protein
LKLNFQDTDDETVLPFEDFIKFLRQNLTDRDKNIRVDNIKVELSNKNELRKIAGKIFVFSMFLQSQKLLNIFFETGIRTCRLYSIHLH